MVNWERLRVDLRSFAQLADFTIEAGASAAFTRRLLANAPNISSKVSIEMLALALCWRVACWPRSTSLIVTPTQEQAKKVIRAAYDLMAEAEDDLRERIHFLPQGKGFSCADSDIVGVVHCSSGTLGLDLPISNEPLTFLIPDSNLLPGPHFTYIRKQLSRPGTTIIINHASRGRIV